MALVPAVEDPQAAVDRHARELCNFVHFNSHKEINALACSAGLKSGKISFNGDGSVAADKFTNSLTVSWKEDGKRVLVIHYSRGDRKTEYTVAFGDAVKPGESFVAAPSTQIVSYPDPDGQFEAKCDAWARRAVEPFPLESPTSKFIRAIVPHVAGLLVDIETNRITTLIAASKNTQ